MNAKLKIIVLSYTPIGNKAQKNLYFSVRCQTTNKVFKSPVINELSSPLKTNQDHFWEFYLSAKQENLVIQMINENQKQKSLQIISTATISQLNKIDEETEAMFYLQKKRIGVLTIRVQKQGQQKPIQSQRQETTLEQDISKLNIQATKRKLNSSEQENESQNERYDMDFTPRQTLNNSVVKIVQVGDHSQMNIFNGLDESSIEERQPFSRGYESFYELTGQIDQMESGDKKINQAQTLQIQTQPSSLEKWLKKLQKFRQKKQKQASSGPLYDCIIPQKYQLKKGEKSENDQKLTNCTTLNLLNLTLDQTLDDSYGLKSLKMKILDGETNMTDRSLFECSFCLANQSNENLSKEIKFNKFITQIPQNVNVQVEICLENLDQSDTQEIKISGILMKDKLFETNQIPLFDQEENIFASLGYLAKKIKNASVQYLSPLYSFIEADPFETINEVQLKKQPLTGKNLIRQRKINKLLKRDISTHNDEKIESPIRKPSKQVFLNSGVRSNVKGEKSLQKFDISLSPQQIPKKRKDSSFSYQLQRSNTDQIPYTKSHQQSKQESQIDLKSKSSRQPSIKRLKSKIQKINEQISKFTGNVSLPISPTKNHHQRSRLMSTNLADLRQEESEDQQENYSRSNNFKSSKNLENFVTMKMPLLSSKQNLRQRKIATEPDRDKYHGYEDTIVRRDYMGDFVIEINAITVVLYEHRKPQDDGNGKFIILKSDSGETFITDTLFSNHLNLNWKNRFYQFKSSKIQIGIYQKTGFSSQAQSKLMGNVELNVVDLMRAIKQNFHRAELFMNDKPIGIVILIYDIFMERESVLKINEEKRNTSEMKMKLRADKITNNTNQTEYLKQQFIRSEKSTIKIQNNPKVRKRAKTLESHKKNIVLPMIDQASNPSRRRPYYEGGKNITIGRAGRFLTSNMAQVVGQW